MTSKLNFFPVGNGDMTLLELESGKKILIDMNIRVAADNPDDETPDVAGMLRERLSRDSQGRLFVDVLLMTHPDKDHCTGLTEHFHLGSPDLWSKQADKIFIRELWSSPMVFRRASVNHTLCDDAKAFNSEARRRVGKFRENSYLITDGDRILILGEDENGKTDDLGAILIRVDETFSRVNSFYDTSMTARLLAPLPKGSDEDEELLSKNHSSTIIQFSLSGDGIADKCRFLTGGDAEVAIWEKLWEKHEDHPEHLSYDILQAPHHCSWHSLSYDSWRTYGEDAVVNSSARNALGQAREGAVIVASSKSINPDDQDPPSTSAKREYESITKAVKGTFKCVSDHPSAIAPDVMEFEVGMHGSRLITKMLKAASVLSSGAIGRQPLGHG